MAYEPPGEHENVGGIAGHAAHLDEPPLQEVDRPNSIDLQIGQLIDDRGWLLAAIRDIELAMPWERDRAIAAAVDCAKRIARRLR
jgi:hypothetical protein